MLTSVVIPTYNRLPILRKCLDALENQILNVEIHSFEIVIVDDGSTDGTVDWLRNNIETYPHLRLFEQSHGGPALGRNLGVEKSKGDLIVFIDGPKNKSQTHGALRDMDPSDPGVDITGIVNIAGGAWKQLK